MGLPQHQQVEDAQPQLAARGSTMLAQLKQVQEELRDCVRNLDEIINISVLDRNRLSSARWRLARARRLRCRLISQICLALSGEVDAADRLKLVAAREESWKAVARSSNFISNWTIDAVERDWSRYCQEASKMNAAWRENLDAEARFLYPLLSRHR